MSLRPPFGEYQYIILTFPKLIVPIFYPVIFIPLAPIIFPFYTFLARWRPSDFVGAKQKTFLWLFFYISIVKFVNIKRVQVLLPAANWGICWHLELLFTKENNYRPPRTSKPISSTAERNCTSNHFPYKNPYTETLLVIWKKKHNSFLKICFTKKMKNKKLIIISNSESFSVFFYLSTESKIQILNSHLFYIPFIHMQF